jgi:rhomboid protease GluP
MLDQEDNTHNWSEEDFKPDHALTPKGILYEKPKAKHGGIILFFALLCLASSIIYWIFPDYGNLLWVSRQAVFEKHEYWRILTALFVHADIMHLISNMPLYIIFGWFLRSYFGLRAFPVAAILVGCLTNLATLYFYDNNTRLIGASGVVYGIVAMWLVFYLKLERRFGFWMKLLRVTGFALVLLLPTTYSPTTSYLAHGFGFLFGLIAAFILVMTKNYDESQEVTSYQ